MTTPLRFSALVLLGIVACKGEAPPPEIQSTTSVAGQSPSTHEHRAAPIAAGERPAAPRRVAPADPVRALPETSSYLPGGTRIEATMQDTVTSQHGSAGQTAIAIVSLDVKDDAGHVLIPAGAPITLTIMQIQAAENSSDSDGTIVLAVTSVKLRGTDYPLSADLESVPHVLVGHGVTLGSAEKVAVGAVLGTIAGRIIGRNTKGAIIGGAIGAGAGVIVANHTQDRDVVVPAGTPIVLALNQPLLVNR